VKELLRDMGLQSGSTLLHLLEHLEGRILPLLKEWKNPELVETAQTLLLRARRRLAGFAALSLHMTATAPPVGDDPKLVYGSPGEAPFLIAFAKANDEGLHVAVQLDQKALLKRMLAEAGPASSKLVVRDARGMRLVGDQGEAKVIAEVPFRHFLPHLRLGTVSLFDARASPGYRTHFVWQILPILIAGLLGILAMVVRFTADRQERELRLRQQEFATRVTHELKTPLAGIRLMAENLEMGAVNDPQTAQEFAGRIVVESERLTQRVDEILQAARQPSSTAMTEIELQDLLLDLVEEWEPRFDDAGLILHTELGRCRPILGDRVLIRDAISNLLDNALKYRRVDVLEPQATLRLLQEGKQAVIEVEDNGLGVPVEKRKVIFERFSRVEGSGRGKAGGHGLGLAFAREAIQVHKGRIECRDGLEGGTCFSVRIPVSSRRRT
jgi:signal transduction histidine kinase